MPALLFFLLTAASFRTAIGQGINFFGPFNSYSQNIVVYPQGIVADANGNLYITGTVNLTYIPVDSSGNPVTANEFQIDNCCGNAYGLAIDTANNLYRPDILSADYNGVPCGVAKYTYNSLDNFTKSCIGSGWVHPSSVSVDGNLNVFVLEAATGTIYKLTPGSGGYSQTAVYGPDTLLIGTTGMSIDASDNLYLTSGPNTGTTSGATYAENSTPAVYKLTLSSGSYTRSSLGSGWTSPSATAVDHLGNVWVSDYGANEVSVLIPNGSSYTQTPYTSIAELRTLVTNKTGQLYGLAAGSGDAVIWTGGSEPHSLVTPNLGSSTTVPVTIAFSQPTAVSNVSVLTEGATGQDFTSSGGTCAAQSYPAGSTCTVDVAFTPQAPGLRTGALVIGGASGSILGTDYLYGVGSGPIAAFNPAIISTYAGTGSVCNGTLSACGDGGPASAATFNNPVGVVFDVSGNLYIADTDDYAVRKVSAAGVITTFAGTGSPCASPSDACGDGGPAASATFTVPTGLAIDGAGNLYIIDSGANRVREVAAGTGIITTIAGNGSTCSSPTAVCGDGGPAASATFNMGPRGGAVADQFGNLVIADSGDNRIRSINLSSGVITTISGVGTACSSPTAACGDGGQASIAQFSDPTGIGADSSGDYFIADTLDNRIRKISYLTGVISTVAGDGNQCSQLPCGDGAAAVAAQLNGPVAAATDTAGDIYIADSQNNVIREVFASTGAISTVAGNYAACGTSTAPCGDGAGAPSAQLNAPDGLALKSSGNLFIADTTNRIRKVTVLQTPALSFPMTDSGSTSAPLSIGLTNIGNATLGFSSAPSLSAGFAEAGSSTCGSSLAGAAGCVFAFEFAPAAAQSYSGNAILTDDNLNETNVQQVIALSGAGTAPVSAATTVASTTLVQYSAATAFSPITGSGGVAPLSYSIAPALPVGLSMSSAGVISGVPGVVSATTNYTVTVTDANGVAATATFQLGVAPGLSATYVGAPLLTQNVAVTPFSPVTGSGGAPPLRYSISPALPAGLTMSSTGLISGTPTVAGFNIYTVTVTDADGNTVSLTFRIIVNGALSATTTVASTTLTQNEAATPFMPVTAAGGAAPITYSVFPALPAGLTMSSAGLISGTPTAVSAGVTYTVKVTDANGSTATATFRLAVDSGMSASAPSGPTTLTVYGSGGPFTPIAVTGGVAPFTYRVSPALPAGLSLSPTTGAITGVATAASGGGIYTITVTDANGASASASFTLMVSKQPTAISVIAAPAGASAGQPVTLTATVSATLAGTPVAPSGTVTFFANGVSLGPPVTLVNGSAQLVATGLPVGGSVVITADYSGDVNFLGGAAAAATPVVVAPLSFTFTGAGASAYTAAPGASATYRFNLAPVNGAYPGSVTFTVAGLPQGAVASFTPTSEPAGGGPALVVMTVQTASTTARLEGGGSAAGYGFVLALLFAPFAGRRTLRRGMKAWALLLAVLAPMLTLALTGCGAPNGFLKQAPQTYTLTVTASGGGVQHSQAVTLIVQ